MAIRVALADGSFLVREALSQLLRADPEMDLISVCRDGDELRAALRELELDVVVSEIRMPPSMTDEGVRIAAELRVSRPTVGVVLLTSYCDADLALGLLESGSERRAYLLKERVHSGRQLTTTIRAIARGGSAIDPVVVESVMAARARRARSPLARLNTAERAVLSGMAQGASNAGIATELHISKRAVEKHINGIFSKLAVPEAPDVSRRVHAVIAYLDDARPQPQT